MLVVRASFPGGFHKSTRTSASDPQFPGRKKDMGGGTCKIPGQLESHLGALALFAELNGKMR